MALKHRMTIGDRVTVPFVGRPEQGAIAPDWRWIRMFVNNTWTSHGLKCGAGPLANSLALRLLLFGHVAGDCGCADDRAVSVADR
jgi:hypothetical protein